MPEFITNPNWLDVIIGALALVVGTGLTVYIFTRQRQIKALSYEIVTSEALLTINEALSGDIQVLYKSEDVKDVHLLVLKIGNTGNVPIKEKDIDSPPLFDFGEKAKILSHEIIGNSPPELPASFHSDKPNQLYLNKLLLNPGDEVSVKILLTQYEGLFIPSCRIEGITQLENWTIFKRTKDHFKLALGMMVAAFFYLTFGSLLVAGLLSGPSSTTPFKQLFDRLIQLAGFVFILIGFIALLLSPVALSPRLLVKLDSRVKRSFPKLWARMKSSDSGWSWF